MKFLYIGRFGLPNTAPGIRVYNMAKLFRKLGHEIIFVCQHEDKSLEKEIYYDGFKYYFENYNTNNRLLNRGIRLCDLILARRTFKKIKKEFNLNEIDGVILYNDPLSLTKKMLKLKNIKVYQDVTEWYGFRESKTVARFLISYLINKRIRKYDEKCNGVVAISEYLYKYYLNKNINVVFIPPIFDKICQEKVNVNKNEKLTISYAGLPESKDLLKIIIEAVKEINIKKEYVRFEIAGIDKNYLKKNYFYNDGDFGIYTHGIVSSEKARSMVKNSDFSILFRYNRRYAKAGYSTKLAESLALGVPVLCNEVGGADMHIKNGFNGFKCLVYDKKNVKNLIQDALNLSYEERLEIKENSYDFAKNMYFIDEYKNTIVNLIKGD